MNSWLHIKQTSRSRRLWHAPFILTTFDYPLSLTHTIITSRMTVIKIYSFDNSRLLMFIWWNGSMKAVGAWGSCGGCRRPSTKQRQRTWMSSWSGGCTASTKVNTAARSRELARIMRLQSKWSSEGSLLSVERALRVNCAPIVDT